MQYHHLHISCNEGKWYHHNVVFYALFYLVQLLLASESIMFESIWGTIREQEKHNKNTKIHSIWNF